MRILSIVVVAGAALSFSIQADAKERPKAQMTQAQKDQNLQANAARCRAEVSAIGCGGQAQFRACV